MTQLSADENARIQYDTSAWRLLLSDEYDRETTLLEVLPDHDLRFSPQFMSAQRLSADPLTTADVAQVVVGWSEEDLCWHLGFTLTPERAAQRGGRWVGLAHWYDPTAAALGEHVQEAGQALAATIAQPFTLIPPRLREKDKSAGLEEQDATDGYTEDYLLPDLPLRNGAWLMEREGEAFVLRRTDAWRAQGLLGVAWYLFWAVAFVLVSLATLLDSLALPFTGVMLPDRTLLPYLGLASGVIIFLLAVRAVIRLYRTISRVKVDPTLHTITAFMGQRQAWQQVADAVQEVYVSQLTQQRGRRQIVQYGEINLRLKSGGFVRVLDNDQEQEKVMTSDEFMVLDSIAPLRDIENELQGMAAYIAEALGSLTCIYDQRKV